MDAATTVRMQRELFESLRISARENERTISGEVRIALKQYLGSQSQAGVANGPQEIRSSEK
jgi:hypothetical protein